MGFVLEWMEAIVKTPVNEIANILGRFSPLRKPLILKWLVSYHSRSQKPKDIDKETAWNIYEYECLASMKSWKNWDWIEGWDFAAFTFGSQDCRKVVLRFPSLFCFWFAAKTFLRELMCCFRRKLPALNMKSKQTNKLQAWPSMPWIMGSIYIFVCLRRGFAPARSIDVIDGSWGRC